VSAAALLAELRRRGIEPRADGDSLRLSGPRSAIASLDLTALRASKARLLAELRGAESEVPFLPDDGVVTGFRERLGAVLVRSRFGEVWLALDPCMLGSLAAEESARPDPRAVLRVEDALRLRGKPDAAIRGALEVARAFPGVQVLQ
jgi:hypothetical protein